jgi:hypothetical protein
MEHFDTTQITLKYLANNIYQETMDKNKEEVEHLERKEINFYKKRIYVYFKQMLKGKYPNNTLKEKYVDYVKTLIEYIKVTDTNELLQEDYKELEQCTEEKIHINENEVSSNNTHKTHNTNADKQMLNIVSEDSKNTLKNFVQIKKVKINTVDTLPYPQIKNINIKSDNYRLKGVKLKNKKTLSDNDIDNDNNKETTTQTTTQTTT